MSKKKPASPTPTAAPLPAPSPSPSPAPAPDVDPVHASLIGDAPTGLPQAHEPVRIVGVGASAGGLAALEEFLQRVPPASGLAFVVVQHMDPTHQGLLPALLQRATRMRVTEAKEGQRVQVDGVYVIPPNKTLTVDAGVLRLKPPAQPRGMRLPIDELFCSLARDQGERAVGVVLSGMGSDGTLGLQEIKSQGGLALAQQPDTAAFDGMPSSAIAAGCTDVVAPPSELPGRILGFINRLRAAPVDEPDVVLSASAEMQLVLNLLLDHSKHDFSLYKPSTIRRRIERRMAVHGLPTLPAYAEFLKSNGQEVGLLFRELLIGVTSFFRDPEVWRQLSDSVLPELLKSQPDGHRFRAWVVGCSTGEEAYSLAILFKEAVAAKPEFTHSTLQIFATDLSSEAIDVARRGKYPPTIAADMSADRLAHFFSKDDVGYRVAKSIREMLIFAPHDVILDPPFTRLDLLTCRNLLIYFNATLQKRVIPVFHYSLRPGGILLLGSSETVGSADDLFETIDGGVRLYRCLPRPAGAGIRLAFPEFPVQTFPPLIPLREERTVVINANPAINLQALADRLLLQDYAPPAVLVNQAGDVVYISGRTGNFLEPASGKANWNIFVMARDGIRAPLSEAIRQVLASKRQVELRGLPVQAQTGTRTVDVTVRCVNEPAALDGTIIIVFRDAPVAMTPKERRTKTSAAHDAVKADLLRTVEDTQALREEMRASQEELQASNEELQSTNEELTTSREEMQSMNEELHTINAELQTKLEALEVERSDMENLLNTTNIATLFLDNQLHLRRFTDNAKKIINLRAGDIGRPLTDLTSHLIYPALHGDAGEVVRTLIPCEKQIATDDGRWFTVRIMPYRTLDHVIRGAVITFVNITDMKALEQGLPAAGATAAPKPEHP